MLLMLFHPLLKKNQLKKGEQKLFKNITTTEETRGGKVAKIIKQTKNEIEIEMELEDSTIVEMLISQLNELAEVEQASYLHLHPLENKYRLYLKAKNPKKAFEKAFKELKKELEALKQAFEKALKE